MGRKRPAVLAHLGQDIPAGAVLGVESVPDGLATGLLAGVNPLAGLNAYMVGTVAGALRDLVCVHGRARNRRDGDPRRGRRRRARRDRPGPRAGHALDADRRRHGGGGVAQARVGAAIRVERSDGRVHQRGRREHRPRATWELHRLQLSSRFASHPRPRHGPAPGPARRTVGRDRSRHDGADRRIGTNAPRSPRPRRRRRHHLSSRERARLGRRDGR